MRFCAAVDGVGDSFEFDSDAFSGEFPPVGRSLGVALDDLIEDARLAYNASVDACRRLRPLTGMIRHLWSHDLGYQFEVVRFPSGTDEGVVIVRPL